MAALTENQRRLVLLLFQKGWHPEAQAAQRCWAEGEEWRPPDTRRVDLRLRSMIREANREARKRSGS